MQNKPSKYSCCFVRSQDIFANVIVNSDLVGQTNKSVFLNLEKEITNFVNNNSWSGNYYSNTEKLKVNILINVLSSNNNKFLANFEFQSTRPVFNSSFITPVFNYVDKNVEFNFEEYQDISNYCKEKNIEWFASAWDIESQKFLQKFDLKHNIQKFWK